MASGQTPGRAPSRWLPYCATTAAPQVTVTLLEAVRAQAPRAGSWICPHCVHYGGGVTCAANVFIALVGGDLSGCQQFAVPEIPPGRGEVMRRDVK